PASSAPAAPAPGAARPAPAGPGQSIPLTRMRRIIAERMALSTSTIPQFRVTREVDLTRTLAVREALLPLQVKLSLTDLLIQACALTLVAQPNANASFVPGPTPADAAIQQHDQVNIGLAVALDDGLVVPVVAGADRLSLLGIAREREALVQAARSGKLSPAQLQGGTFTISNLGAYGVDSFDAIINPPEAAILAVGQVVRKPVVTAEGAVEVRPMLSLTLTCDHRVLDGAAAARLLGSLADRLQLADQYRLA
ncbi:MAG: Catalytic protein of component of various dehydrogenase complexe, partial [Firmicutes bacterium]|nr:Catalytic protein of component of various dehydrogenase complexe [Bacillota bacterium]